jgi:hypothetical protein
MSEWDEDRAALVRRLEYLARLQRQGKKWARDEWMVEFRRLMDWYADRRQLRDEGCSRADSRGA